MYSLKMERLPRKSQNYTHQERAMLMAIVKRYKPTVDCKKTDKLSVAKKEVVWNAIAKTYNQSRFRTTGYRSAESLKRLFMNTKFRTRAKLQQAQKNAGQDVSETPAFDEIPLDVQIEGVNDISEAEEEALASEQPSLPVEGNDLVINVKIERDLKKPADEETKDPTGGSYDPLSTEADQRILDILDEGPEENLYNEAAEFFQNSHLPVVTQLGADEDSSDADSPIIPETISHPKRLKKPLPFVKRRSKPPLNVENEICGEIMTNKSSEFLKRVYYRKKIELVHLKKRNEIQKYQYEQLKQYLEIKILNKQLEKGDGK